MSATHNTALGRLIDTKIRQRNLINQDVADLSRNVPGGPISTAAVAKYRNGIHPASPSLRMLRLLSETLDIPLQELEQAAQVPVSLGEWVPPAEASRMTLPERQSVENLIRLFASRRDDEPSVAA